PGVEQDVPLGRAEERRPNRGVRLLARSSGKERGGGYLDSARAEDRELDHPRSSSSTAAYGSSERSATRATAAARRDSPTRPASSRSKASCKSASTSLLAAARRRSTYSPDSRDHARCLSIASTSCGRPSPDSAAARTI